MIPTDKQREALRSSILSPEVRRTAESQIANAEHRLGLDVKTVAADFYAQSVARAARTYEAMAEDEQRVKEILAERNPSNAKELQRIRERQPAYRAAIDELQRATEEAARIAADPVAHGNELLAKYPALGGA